MCRRMRLVVVMTALGAMDVLRWFLRRRSQLAGEHNSAGFMLLRQMFCNFRVECFDIADHAQEKPARLKALAGKFCQQCQCAIENFRRRAGVGYLLRLLFDECVIFLFEPFGKNRHRRGRHMERAEGTAQGLDGRKHFSILTIPPVMEIAECDDFDQVEQRGRLFAAGNGELTIEFPSDGGELLAEALLLIVASRIEVFTIRRAGDAGEAMLSATLAANQPAEGRTGTFPFPLLTVDTLAHLRDDPSFSAFCGSTNP